MRLSVLLAALASCSAFAQSKWIDDCGLVPPGQDPWPAVPTRPFEPTVTAADPPVVTRVRAHAPRNFGVPSANASLTGALAGKTIYLSPGHGFTWNSGTVTGWLTQRGNTNAIVEDLVSAETLDQFLIPMLLNAGAQVVPVRETDLTTAMAIVDDSDVSSGYTETGSGFSDSTLAAFGRPTGFPATPMDGSTNPFTLAKNRLMTAAATDTAQATYSATLPAAGFYNVYVSYSEYTARVSDAHYVVRHSGGESHFRVNQRRHGGTWVLLGRFHFSVGQPAQVVVHNDSSQTGNVSLDAVRFGGGMGFIDRGGGVSGRPRFEESARYQTQWAGARATVYAGSSGNLPSDDRTNDVRARSRFAAWAHETGEDALYFAWHTNATGGAPTARGTTTYVYGPNAPDGTYNFTGTPGSDRVAQLVHGELINDLRASTGWNEPTWRDRGIDSAYFGEISPTENPEMPAALCELAFHDNATDSARIKEPTWRYVAARAIAQGMIKYFAEKDGVTARLFPEPPEQLFAVVQPSGQVLVSWSASPTDTQGVRGPAATSYRVYQSAGGLGWDEGTDVTGTSTTLALPSGQARFFRVAGVNAGGESFPSASVGARAPSAGQGKVLVVNAYDRFDAAIGWTESIPAVYSLGSVVRILLPRMNDGALLDRWGDALDVNQVGFDSATADAVNAGGVSLGSYALVAWAQGRGHANGAAPTTQEQTGLKAFRTVSKPLLFSGRAVTDATFASDVLLASGSAGAGSRAVTGAGPLNGLTLALDDGTQGSYDWPLPDVAAPVSPGVSLGTFASGSTGGAGTGAQGQVAYLGFAFEGIVGRTERAEVMRRLLAFLAPQNVVVSDAGVDLDAGTPPGPEDAGTPPEPGMDGGASVQEPVLSFVGGGCSSAPGALLAALALAWLVRRRR